MDKKIKSLIGWSVAVLVIAQLFLHVIPREEIATHVIKTKLMHSLAMDCVTSGDEAVCKKFEDSYLPYLEDLAGEDSFYDRIVAWHYENTSWGIAASIVQIELLDDIEYAYFNSPFLTPGMKNDGGIDI